MLLLQESGSGGMLIERSAVRTRLEVDRLIVFQVFWLVFGFLVKSADFLKPRSVDNHRKAPSPRTQQRDHVTS